MTSLCLLTICKGEAWDFMKEQQDKKKAEAQAQAQA
jgi:hypothetical protein